MKVAENPEVFVNRPGTCPPLDVDGKSLSDWDTFAAKKGSILDGSSPNTTINEYERWEETVELLKMAGANS